MLLVAATVAHAAELPDSVPASKCRAHKKIFAALDDGSSTATPRIIKISSAFYFQAGSVAIHGCKTFKGSAECRESVDLGLLLAPGFIGELPCTSVLYLNYSLASEDGGQSEYWSNTTTDCTVTIVKNDPEKGRLKGTYRAHLTGGSGPELAAGEIVGCFSAKQQDL
jgi:hypothetical protein